MPNRKLAATFVMALGAAWLTTCPAQAQPLPSGLPPMPALGSPVAESTPDAQPAESNVDDLLSQLEQLRRERAALETKERTLTELLRRKIAEQGERLQKLGLKEANLIGEPAKRAAAESASEAGLLYFPTRVGTRRVYESQGIEKVDLVTAVRAQESGAVTVTVSNQSVPGAARYIRVSRAAIKLVPGPDGEGGRDVLRPAAARGEEWLPWGKGGLVFRQAGFEQVTVPAGTFRALRVDTSWQAGPEFRVHGSVWYAPGVGTVREVNDGVEVLALKSFEPGD